MIAGLLFQAADGAAHTGHRSLTALRRYFRRDVFRANACGMVGL